MFAAILITCAALAKGPECIYSIGPAEFLNRMTCETVKGRLMEAPTTQSFIAGLVKEHKWGTADISSRILCMSHEEYKAFEQKFKKAQKPKGIAA